LSLQAGKNHLGKNAAKIRITVNVCSRVLGKAVWNVASIYGMCAIKLET